MRVFTQFPIAALSPYIDRFWGWEAVDGESVALPTVLPGTGAEMFFHYRSPFRMAQGQVSSSGTTHLLCVRHRPVALAATSGVGFIAVRFRAGALHRFTRIPGGELADRLASPADLWGKAGAMLADRVTHAASNQRRVSLLQDFLLMRLEDTRADMLVIAASERLYRSPGGLAIDTLASALGIGKRQLERRFRQVTGQSPVEVRRLGRFQKTARGLLLGSVAGGADAAVEHGYYDQPHFIREFKDIAGLPPRAFLAEARLKTHFYNTPRHASGKMQFADQTV